MIDYGRRRRHFPHNTPSARHFPNTILFFKGDKGADIFTLQ